MKISRKPQAYLRGSWCHKRVTWTKATTDQSPAGPDKSHNRSMSRFWQKSFQIHTKTTLDTDPDSEPDPDPERSQTISRSRSKEEHVLNRIWCFIEKICSSEMKKRPSNQTVNETIKGSLDQHKDVGLDDKPSLSWIVWCVLKWNCYHSSHCTPLHPTLLTPSTITLDNVIASCSPGSHLQIEVWVTYTSFIQEWLCECHHLTGGVRYFISHETCFHVHVCYVKVKSTDSKRDLKFDSVFNYCFTLFMYVVINL